MSDGTSADTGSGESAFGSAKAAAAAAAEKVRESAPGAYDASAKAARYVGDTASEHPAFVLIGTAALAFLGGLLKPRKRRKWSRSAEAVQLAEGWTRDERSGAIGGTGRFRCCDERRRVCYAQCAREPNFGFIDCGSSGRRYRLLAAEPPVRGIRGWDFSSHQPGAFPYYRLA